MIQTRWLAPAIMALTACAGPGALAQEPPGSGPEVRPRLYGVAPDPSVQAPNRPGFIEVSGTASVEVAADRAHITFAVETRAETGADAASRNAAAMDAVFRALRGGGFSGLDIETFGYSLRPEYSFDTQDGRRSRRVDGYTTLNNIRVTLSDLDAVGRLVDTAIRAGANRVASLTFDASDTKSAREEALENAVAEAKRQARVIAHALGYELGTPLEVRGGAQRQNPRTGPVAFQMRTEEAAMTPVEAGSQKVTASVTIRFALGAERSSR
jgi:uncharacterized protein